MTAPAHLRGKIDRTAPEALKSERLEWVRENKFMPIAKMASALGVSRVTVNRLKKQAGATREPSRDRPWTRGVTVGRATTALMKMSQPAQDALELHAARTGKTLCEIMADAWENRHQTGESL